MLVALLIAGFVVIRRRKGAEQDFGEPPLEPLAAAEPAPAPIAAPPAAEPAPANMREQARGELEFQPLSMRLSLVYATLRFRVTLKALTEIAPATLRGDMISAHGSLGQDEQLKPALDGLTVLGEVPRLSPGEGTEIEGEIQLPISAIKPVREGSISRFVPLVRLAFVDKGEAPDAPHLDLGCVFALGEAGKGDTLGPLRIDTGPREFRELAGREIEQGRRRAF